MLTDSGYYYDDTTQKEILGKVLFKNRLKYKKKLLWLNLGGTITAQPVSSSSKFRTGVVATDLLLKNWVVDWLDRNHCDFINSKVMKLSEEYTHQDLLVLKDQLEDYKKAYETIIVTLGTDNLSVISTWFSLLMKGKNFYLLADQRSLDKPTNILKISLKTVEYLVSRNLKQWVVAYDTPWSMRLLLPGRVTKLHSTRKAALDDGLGSHVNFENFAPVSHILTAETINHKLKLTRLFKELKLEENLQKPIVYHHISNTTEKLYEEQLVVSLGMNNLSQNYRSCYSKTRVPLGEENITVYSSNTHSKKLRNSQYLSTDGYFLLLNYTNYHECYE